jgi:hypothetical protein
MSFYINFKDEDGVSIASGYPSEFFTQPGYEGTGMVFDSSHIRTELKALGGRDQIIKMNELSPTHWLVEVLNPAIKTIHLSY